MSTASRLMYQWNPICWPRVERKVFKLQKRIYRAAQRGEYRQVRRLQRRLRRSHYAELLAARQVTQDNRGQKTPGVDGMAALTPPERLALAEHLQLDGAATPVRRVYIPQPDTREQRPLGIPIIVDRVKQRMVKQALEPEWEARFEPHSYGFRPGRSTWDAIGAISVQINQKPKWVLDADIAKCFDRIDHDALLRKLNAQPTLSRQIKSWLKTGVLDKGDWYPTDTGTPPGGPVSPLLANVALHGLEERIRQAFPGRRTPAVIRYAEDLVVLHPDREVIEPSQALIAEHLRGMGLELKPSKTRITRTWQVEAGGAGFDFLGFNIRQYPTKAKRGDKTSIKPSRTAMEHHKRQIVEVVRRHRADRQERLIEALNPVIRGWCHYFSTVCSKETFEEMDERVRQQLRSWSRFRHPHTPRNWGYQKDWRQEGERVYCAPRSGGKRFARHTERPIRRHVKVQARRSPYDGDEVYWSTRRGHYPGVSKRVATLLKRQAGKCRHCGGSLKADDVLEVEHIIPRAEGGRDAYANWQLWHRYCYLEKTARERRRCAGQAPHV
jgi:RNA-directed DNA polymerase